MTSPWDEPPESIAPPHLSQEMHGGFVQPKTTSEAELHEAEERHLHREAAEAAHVPWYRRIFRRS
jgi:hypothetical protein